MVKKITKKKRATKEVITGTIQVKDNILVSFFKRIFRKK